MVDATGVPTSEQLYAHFAGFDAFGAMPSVHMLWALLTAVGLWLGIQHRVARLVSLVFPCTIAVTVIVTGNHYVLDCLVAALILAVSACALWLGRRLSPGTRERANSEQRRGSGESLDPLNGPFVLGAIVSVILLAGNDFLLRIAGALFLGATFGVVILARRRVRMGNSLGRSAARVDALCGLLLVAGVTVIDADAPGVRLCGAGMWLTAGALPLAATVWPARRPHAVRSRHAPSLRTDAPALAALPYPPNS
jgi:hypothetical protein